MAHRKNCQSRHSIVAACEIKFQRKNGSSMFYQNKFKLDVSTNKIDKNAVALVLLERTIKAKNYQ